MADKYFDNVNGIGTLYLEHIFYEFESEPILFTCTNDEKELYLCLCSDIRYGQKWVAVRCEIPQLKALIQQETDIVSVFLASKAAAVITMDLQGNESSSIVNIDKVDRLDLPEEGTFIRCDKEKALDYLWGKEYELLCAQVKAVMNMPSALDEAVNLYSSVLNTSIKFNKQTKLYSDSESKEFYVQSNISGELFEETAAVRYEHSFDKNEKYDPIDCMEIDSASSHSSLHAA